jgi:hypothetical protein
MVKALKADPPGWYRDNKLNAAQVAAARAGAEKEMTSMDAAAHHKMMRQHADAMREMHFRMLWVHFLNILLGVWLVTTPFVFGSFDQTSFPDTILHVTHDRVRPGAAPRWR